MPAPLVILSPSVMPAPLVIPAPSSPPHSPPSSPHPLRHPRTLPSFLRPLRHSCVGRNPCDHRTPVHAPGPRRPTEALEGAATRSGFRSDGAPSNVAVPLATPQNAWIPASRSCLPPRHSCAGRNPCDHRTPVHAPGPRRPTEALGGAATRSGFRSDGAPSNVAVPLATPQSAWIPACARIHTGGAGVTQGVGIIEGAREAAGRRTQHS